MQDEIKIQKKKTAVNTALDILFKSLVGVAISIFGYIAFTKVNLSTNKVSFDSKSKSTANNSVPPELKWYDSFRGIENVPSKKQKEEKKTNGTGGTGFNFKGF